VVGAGRKLGRKGIGDDALAVHGYHSEEEEEQRCAMEPDDDMKRKS